ncbi:hypothetical protein [Azospirillum sp. SYSU D00513]|uniref:hypothetical protein n=1 Tax=Azospirillum sp. SYSU D00513 TaxID=2812561 RepID=UPI001A977794|nr:hypothetical protein [Azospirillum sp. SYSU D00513]
MTNLTDYIAKLPADEQEEIAKRTREIVKKQLRLQSGSSSEGNQADTQPPE